ncbi:MAG TPA: cadherin-like domain-containing protein [Ramlibacter sp.]|nr:cadherin-like domain-containing protein [Ramlibacter sp.]
MKSRTINATNGLSRLKLGLGLLSIVVAGTWATQVHAARGNAPVSGEIQFITINNPADHWSGGTIVVGGTSVILPRNLLLDLPANRLTLKQLFDQAPAACVALGQTGLAKGDTCNTTGMGGIAAISANRSAAGNVIAGDVLISKAGESVTGEVTYIDYTDGYFRLNGNPGDPATGVMVRLNDPTSRHTVQQGLGCAPGAPNCSADPRFTLDPDNYVNVFSSGYPYCIPSTVQRTASIALPSQVGVTIPALTVGAIVKANADGTGDALCPTTNRTINGGQPVDDSRRFAPVMLGDSVTAEGNFELVNGVQFLSAHTTMIGNNALATKADPGQPDYIFLDEVGLDAAGFQNQRARSLFIGFSSLDTDVVIWSIHRDPTTGAAHEFPLASVAGCDIAAGAGTCGGQGLVGAGNRIWKIRHDVDFAIGAKARWDPCAHLRADPRFSGLNICPGSNAVVGGGGGGGGGFATNINEMFSILSPMPREIQARTGHKLANPSLLTLDINGNQATNGQYLFPFGANLGGIAFPEMVEIDLNQLNLPMSFTGLPWTLDRRLSPGGCNGPCETTAQPLDPYPYEGFDPRTQASVPTTSLTDRNYTDTTLTNARDRIISYVDVSKVRLAGNGFETPAAGNFNGNATLLALPPIDPAQQPITVTPVVPPFVVSAAATNGPPVAVADSVTTDNRTPVTIAVLANDSDPNGNTLSVVSLTAPTSGTVRINPDKTVTFTPVLGFVGPATFGYTISDGSATASANVIVTVTQPGNSAPTAVNDSLTTAVNAINVPFAINLLANDTDPDGAADLVAAVNVTALATNPPGATFTVVGGTATFSAPTPGTYRFTYNAQDKAGALSANTATVTVTVPAPPPPALSETIGVSLSQFVVSKSNLQLKGTVTPAVAETLTFAFVNAAGTVLGSAGAINSDNAGKWQVNSTIALPAGSTVIRITTAKGTVQNTPLTIK